MAQGPLQPAGDDRDAEVVDATMLDREAERRIVDSRPRAGRIGWDDDEAAVDLLANSSAWFSLAT